MHITKSLSLFQFSDCSRRRGIALRGIPSCQQCLCFTARSLPSHLKASLLFCTSLTPTHPSHFPPLLPFCIIHQSTDLLSSKMEKKKRDTNVTYIPSHCYSLLLLVIPFESPIDVTLWDVDILQMQHDSSGVYGSTCSTEMFLGDIQVH